MIQLTLVDSAEVSRPATGRASVARHHQLKEQDMKPKYFAEFPQHTQYRGRHYFYTQKERAEFVRRALARGYTPIVCGIVKPVLH
jgi:hypothetical protein